MLKFVLFFWLPLAQGQCLAGNVDMHAWEVSPFVTSPGVSIFRTACFFTRLFSEKCSEQKMDFSRFSDKLETHYWQEWDFFF